MSGFSVIISGPCGWAAAAGIASGVGGVAGDGYKLANWLKYRDR